MPQGARTDLEPSADLPNVISQPEAAVLFNTSERMIRGAGGIEPVIYAEAKLGELLNTIPLSEKRSSSQKKLVTLPSGISKATSHQAQTIANNPEKVEVANELYASRVANMTKSYAGKLYGRGMDSTGKSADAISQPEAAK